MWLLSSRMENVFKQFWHSIFFWFRIRCYTVHRISAQTSLYRPHIQLCMVSKKGLQTFDRPIALKVRLRQFCLHCSNSKPPQSWSFENHVCSVSFIDDSALDSFRSTSASVSSLKNWIFRVPKPALKSRSFSKGVGTCLASFSAKETTVTVQDLDFTFFLFGLINNVYLAVSGLRFLTSAKQQISLLL